MNSDSSVSRIVDAAAADSRSVKNSASVFTDEWQVSLL